MPWIIKQMFIALLSFSLFLAIKYVPYMIRQTHIDWNLVELNYYPFVISLDKCNGSYNVNDDLSKNMFRVKKKDVNVKACSMKTRISEYDCKCKFYNATCNLIEKRIMINANVSVKSIV